ncbi:MAG: MFS transporter [Gemmatimonadaceae bacterium]|nr:MFS transporter [Acetobacteraceae bacterium]
MGVRSPLPRFVAYYAALFAAFGAASPFLPGLLQESGLGSGELGVVLASGTAVRLLTGPLGARIADRTGRAPIVLSCLTAAAALIATAYAPARGLFLLIAVSVAHAAVLAPLTPIADALTIQASGRGRVFRYGWVRGAGSAAFIAGTLAAGQMVGWAGLGVIVWLNAGLLAVAACFGWLLRGQAGPVASAPVVGQAGSIAELLRVPVFVRMMAVAALIGGSHAMHDGFGVIRWRAAGLSPGECSVLWSMSVAAEVGVFLSLGPWLLDRFGIRAAVLVAASAGIVRWATTALTSSFAAMALVEPLHGLTFALLHLACMEVIAGVVPGRIAATAQAFYATVVMGLTGVLLTLVSGPLYGQFGATSFWAMAGMCGLALPVARGLQSRAASDQLESRRDAN